MANNYVNNPNEYVEVITLKGKKKEIITYKKNKYGLELRKSHKRILRLIKKYKSSKCSFAYKQKTSTKNALQPHMNSNLFIKMDISSFFRSIKLDLFLEVMGEAFEYKDEIKECFYDNALPIGFITSPKISDMYLYNFDIDVENYLSTHSNLFYSRYCDDIMISTMSNDFSELHALKSFIVKKLLKLGLKINEEKYRVFDIKVDKTVTFLGLNITEKEGNRTITISKTFIVKTLDKLKEYYELVNQKRTISGYLRDCNKGIIVVDKDTIEEKVAEFIKINKTVWHYHHQICSRVSYIHYNSLYAYNYFLKKHKNWFGAEWKRISRPHD